MIRRLIPAVVAVALLVACSPDKTATYKRPTPKPTTTTVPQTFEQKVAGVRDCKTLTLMLRSEAAKLPQGNASGAPENSNLAETRRNLATIQQRQVALNCGGAARSSESSANPQN